MKIFILICVSFASLASVASNNFIYRGFDGSDFPKYFIDKSYSNNLTIIKFIKIDNSKYEISRLDYSFKEKSQGGVDGPQPDRMSAYLNKQTFKLGETTEIRPGHKVKFEVSEGHLIQTEENSSSPVIYRFHDNGSMTSSFYEMITPAGFHKIDIRNFKPITNNQERRIYDSIMNKIYETDNRSFVSMDNTTDLFKLFEK